MPANTSMQGTYIPQYTQVPGTNISVEVGSSCAALTQSGGLNPSCKTVVVVLIILTIYCFPAFRTAPSNSPLPSRRPRNTQATPTSITSEEVAVVGDHLPCLCLCMCVFGGGAALQTLIKSFILQRCCQVRLCSRGMSLLIGSLCCGPCARSPPLHPPGECASLRGADAQESKDNTGQLEKERGLLHRTDKCFLPNSRFTNTKLFCPSPRPWEMEDRNNGHLF